MSSKLVGASERMRERIGPPSSWNTPIERPLRSISKVGSSSRGTSSMSSRRPVEASMSSSVRSMTDRFRRPRKSILRRPRSSTPCISYWVTIGASSRRAAGLGLALDRQVLGQRVPGDDDGGGVDAVLAAETLEAEGHVADPLHVGVGLVEVAQLAGHLVAVLELVLLLEAGVERRVPAHDQRGHELGDLVADGVGVAEHPGGVAHRGPGLDGGERDDLGHVVGAVALGGVADHLGAVALVEVHVDVGHLLAAGVEEPLEEEAVAERVEVDDLQAVGDAAAGRGPPARARPGCCGRGRA